MRAVATTALFPILRRRSSWTTKNRLVHAPRRAGRDPFLELLGVAALILLNAYFVAAEYGLVTARRTRIQELAQKGDRRARAVLRIVADPPRFIAAMQLGVTATSLAIGALGEQVLAGSSTRCSRRSSQ